MVRHIVFWKIKDSTEKQQNIKKMMDMLNALSGRIEGLISIEAGHVFDPSSDYDVVLYSSFESNEALEFYQSHPEHVKCKEFISGIAEKRVAADYAIEEPATDTVPEQKQEGPEIIVTRPPKRELKEPVFVVGASDTKKDVPNKTITSEQSEKAPHIPSSIPDITVFKPGEEPVVFKGGPVPSSDTPETFTENFESAPINIEEPETAPAAEPAPMRFEDIEPAPMKFEDIEPAPMKFEEPKPAPMKFEQPKPAPAAPVAPAPATNTVKETKTPFGKKKVDVEFTPLDQRSDTWTCPNCGKVMPNYVGTCGCGEPKPFDFGFGDEVAAAAPVSEPAPMKFEEPKPAPMKFEQTKAAPVAPTPATNTVKETKTPFGKKKVDVEFTPLDQRSDTWTCPNCGKVMPNYVGTCGCGEPKPFDFGFGDEVAAAAPVSEPAPMKFEEPKPAPKKFEQPKAAPAAPVAPAPATNTVKETKTPFGKKKVDVEFTPLDQRSDTWTCPNCGKVMPNYVGTCGCGEPKPFDFGFGDEVAAAAQKNEDAAESLPDIAPNLPIKNKMTPEQLSSFDNVQPTIQGYNPQVNGEVPTYQGGDYNYINQDESRNNADPNYQAPDLSFIKNKDQFNNDATNFVDENKDMNTPLDPFDFDNAPPAAPMRFSDAPPAYLGFNDTSSTVNNASPKPAEPPKPAVPEYQRPLVSDFSTSKNSDKKKKEPKKARSFGKKAREEDAYQQALENVSNRRDVPNDGTWTCPNCGKVMPKYVGTCGCGESQPFEF